MIITILMSPNKQMCIRDRLGGIVVLRTILSVFLNKEIKELESEEK